MEGSVSLKIARWVGVLAMGAGLLAACGSGDEAPMCRCAPTEVCEDGRCVAVGDDIGPGTGMFTRTALMRDGRLVAVTRDRQARCLQVIAFDAQGALIARHALRSRVENDGPALGADTSDGGWWPAVAVAGETVHVVWHDASDGRLFHAAGDVAMGFGTVTVIDGGGPEKVGTHTSIAIGGDGAVHVAYRDETLKRLKYAVLRPGTAWATEAVPTCAGERTCPVAGLEDAGEYASLVLVPASGGGDSPRIAFYDRLRGDLKLAARGANEGNGPWQVTTLDGRQVDSDLDTGDVGRFASLALTPGRNLAVVYVDDSRGALRALSPGGATRVLDDGVRITDDGRRVSRIIGQFARLRIDPAGVWHVMHLDASRLVWVRTRVDGERISEREELAALPAGGWLDFAVEDTRLVGALGAFDADGRLGTRLQWFEVVAP